ncbi:MAG: alpha/beta hydrolase [Sphingomonadales bacterium]|nr:alpha/beta hydrolase [Sphingomonadales bacterium]
MSEYPEYGELMPGFRWHDIDAGGVRIRAAVGGSGPPLLLLHGHPQTHLTWHKVAPELARRFTVVATDLRGYGDSEKLPGDPEHRNYSKRAMAADQVAAMATLGFDRFAVVAHDRGARVAHRMALDHPDRVDRIVLIDIAPTATMYAQTNREFPTRYFWWFFLIQPFDLPERMIGADPDHFLDRHLAGQIKIEGALYPKVVAEYRRCYRDPATRHAICEDYRAAASIDLDHDAADDEQGRLIEAPLLLLWGEYGTVGTLFDVLGSWRSKARAIDGRPLPCGHSPQEEVPELLLAELDAFFATS